MTLPREIYEWAREEPFPREVGLDRVIVKNEEEFKKHLRSTDMYASIFNLNQLFYEKYDVLFFDLDGKNGGIDESYSKLQWFLKNVDYKVSRAYFSGVGFHVYIYLKKPILGRDTYKDFSKKFIEANSLSELVDHSAVGDVRRVARLPGTVNSRSSLKMVEISPQDSKDAVLQRAKEYKPFRPPRVDSFIFDVSSATQVKQDTFPETVSWTGIYPPCILNAENFLCELGELGHSGRIHLASFLLKIGREDELRKYLKMANDYNKYITEYQIDYLKKTNYMPFACKNVVNEICSYSADKKKCPFYPHIFSKVKE